MTTPTRDDTTHGKPEEEFTVSEPATRQQKNALTLTEDDWKTDIFPEWGTWLNEEIDHATIAPSHLGLWWIANMGVWFKTSGNTNIAIDLWCSTGKTTHDKPDMPSRHQWRRALGARHIQPNLRATPMTFNPFSIRHLDALLATHFHHDHIDEYVAAAVLRNCPGTPFIGPEAAATQWRAWGVPDERIRVVRPGDTLTIGDTTIEVLESFDRTALITDPVGMPQPADDVIPPMAERAVNYLLHTDAGTVYHAGDSHYSTRYAQHGDQHDIDIALVAYGENPVAVHDKMTSSDVLRAAEALRCKVVIPLHWDAWTNTIADPQEIQFLWRYRRDRFHYRFHPYSWMPGGRLDWPDDHDSFAYYPERGFDDRYRDPINLPYPEMF